MLARIVSYEIECDARGCRVHSKTYAPTKKEAIQDFKADGFSFSKDGKTMLCRKCTAKVVALEKLI